MAIGLPLEEPAIFKNGQNCLVKLNAPLLYVQDIQVCP
jgi:hypothetical protein